LHPSGPHSRHHSGVSLGPPSGYRATLPGRKCVSLRRGRTVVCFGNRVGGGGGGGARGCVDRVERGDAFDADLVVADWALHDRLGGSAVRHLLLDDLGHAVFHRALLGVVAGKDLVAELHGGQHGDHMGGAA
jgi:hypothetical protein